MERRWIEGSWQKKRAFSPAVVTRGGTTVWLAGHGATRDAEGKTLAGDFEAQAHAVFRYLSETLEQAGGTLVDIVTMTVFILDVRHGDRFVEIRRDYFPEHVPASALITVAGFANPDMMIEIQGVAVVAK